jgi:hypothetical protein
MNPSFTKCIERFGGKPFPSCLTAMALRNVNVDSLWGPLQRQLPGIIDKVSQFLDPAVGDVIKNGVRNSPEGELEALGRVLPAPHHWRAAGEYENKNESEHARAGAEARLGELRAAYDYDKAKAKDWM